MDATLRKLAEKAADYLLEDGGNFKVKNFSDRLILRFFNSPALMANLKDMAILTGAENGVPDGDYKFQLKFNRLPDEVIEQVKKLIGVSKVRVYDFIEGSTAFTGFEFLISADATGD